MNRRNFLACLCALPLSLLLFRPPPVQPYKWLVTFELRFGTQPGEIRKTYCKTLAEAEELCRTLSQEEIPEPYNFGLLNITPL